MAEKGIGRQAFIRKGVALGVGGFLGLRHVTPVGADETPVPTREVTRTPAPKNPKDAAIEELGQKLSQIKDDKLKDQIIADLTRQIAEAVRPPGAPIPSDPKDAKITELERNLTDTRKELTDFKKTISSDPNVFLYTKEQLTKYIDSGVEVKLNEIRKAESGQRADAAQDRAEAQRIRNEAEGEANRIKTEAAREAETKKGKIDLPVELPLVGKQADSNVALLGAGAAGWGIFRGLERFVGRSRVVENRRRAQETAALTRFLTDAGVTIAGTAITPRQVQQLFDNGYTIGEYQLARAVFGIDLSLQVEGDLNEIDDINAISDPVDREKERKDRLRTEESELMDGYATANSDQKRLTEVSLQRIFTQLGGAGRP